MKRIVRELVVHGPNDVTQGVQTDHIGGPVSAALGTPQARPGQVIDHVHGQTVPLGLDHHRDHAKDPDPVGNEVRRVLGANHPLAQGGREKALETIEHIGTRLRDRDQLGQMHVARRIKEMHPAKTRLQILWKCLGQRANRQPRGVRRQHRVRRDHRCNASIKIVLPVQTFSDRLNDQITFAEQGEVVFIIGGPDRIGQSGQPQRCRAEFAQAGDRALGDGATRGRRGLVRRLGLRLSRQIKQHGVDASIGQVGRNLCAHDA